MVETVTVPSTQVEAIQHLETSLVDAIRSASGIGWSDVAVAIAVAFLGAFSAYLFNHMHWITVIKREKSSAQLTGLATLISSFESVAVAYWVSAQSSQSLEAQVLIKARHRAILNQRRTLAALLHDEKHLELHRSLQKFSDDVFDAATGGDFESVNRRPSESTATRIAVLAADILALIANQRNSQ